MSTKIEWVVGGEGDPGDTLNVLTGCSKKSLGCRYCYAEVMSKRLKAMGMAKYKDVVGENGFFNGVVRFHKDVLDVPYRRAKPQTYFVNSMSDTFHESVPLPVIKQIFQMMYDNPQHTFMLLTKRAERQKRAFDIMAAEFGGPLKNVWAGVSVENQDQIERIDWLIKTNATIRFLSLEPLLGPVDLTPFVLCLTCGGHGELVDYSNEEEIEYQCPVCNGEGYSITQAIDWVIVGGESGKKARPMKASWVRSIRDVCTMGGVSFFFKQWGRWIDVDQAIEQRLIDTYTDTEKLKNIRGTYYAALGKKKAGNKLDGQTWLQVPKISF